MLNVSDLRSLSRQELEDKIAALKKSLFEMISQKETGRIEKPSNIKKARRDIARIMTVLREMK
ncbi:MAG: 50S ribosomal protein L29 [Candidatus Omnitrophica bacterium CG1_02_40_15]|nr:MAG: 50S ribosomal protein L29 [Candidatus Omnitrophica bacterium CG1_02_40_15]